MFEKIGDYSLQVFHETPKVMFCIPDSAATLAAKDLWKMNKWLYDEFLGECKISEQRPDEEFQLHNTCRVLAYVNNAYSLDILLRTLYESMCASLGRYVNERLTVNIGELGKRKDEFRSLEKFRHMVSAHTVYADPRPDKGDRLSTQFTSLYTLKSFSYEGNDWSTFTLGAIRAGIDGEVSARQVPIIKFRDAHRQMIEHFERWEAMFCATLRGAESYLPILNDKFRVLSRTGR